MKSLAQQRTKNQKALQEKMKLNQKEAKRFNPVSSYIIADIHCLLECPLNVSPHQQNNKFLQVDAFPGDIVIFTRVLNLLRGIR